MPAPVNRPGVTVIRPPAEVAIPLLAFTVGAATTLTGLAIRVGGGEIGATLPPFWATLTPEVSLYAIPALALIAAGLAAARRLRDPVVSPVAFAAATAALTLGLRLALAAARAGPGDWSAVFGSAHEATQEYLPALPALHVGSGQFLARFAEISPTLPSHPSAHPPGLLLTLHGLGITTAGGMAALTIATGALSTPLVYALGRGLADEARARTRRCSTSSLRSRCSTARPRPTHSSPRWRWPRRSRCCRRGGCSARWGRCCSRSRRSSPTH